MKASLSKERSENLRTRKIGVGDQQRRGVLAVLRGPPGSCGASSRSVEAGDWDQLGGTRCVAPRCTALFVDEAVWARSEAKPSGAGAPWWAPQSAVGTPFAVRELGTVSASLTETFAACLMA